MGKRSAGGVLIVFVVEDIDGEYARLQREGVAITTPIETEPWSERFFQVTDPNGVVIQLVQWMNKQRADWRMPPSPRAVERAIAAARG